MRQGRSGFWQNCVMGFLLFAASSQMWSQPVPGKDENIPYLVTFGRNAETSWGDDDFSQTFFFVIPKEFTSPLYIRVYDPDCGGGIDELKGLFDTRTSFTVYGGVGCYSNEDVQTGQPHGNYKAGNLLATRTFGIDARYDQKWYTFGPFNPTEGEYVEQFKGYIIKIIAEGVSGDDGNLYRYFLSTSPDENKPIEGGNAFTFEYCFRLWDDPKQISVIYPYIDDRTINVRESNFDWDDDGYILITSVMRKSQPLPVSNENDWVESDFKIFDKEHNTSLAISMIKRSSPVVRNNNVVMHIRNQYNEVLKFYSSPIGGIPKPTYGIGVR